MAAVTTLAKIIDDIHADTSTTYKVTKIKMPQATLNDVQTEFNKLTGSNDEVTNILGIPVEVDQSISAGDIKYTRDFIEDATVTLTLS